MELRVLLRTATARDAAISAAVLQRGGIEALACPTTAALIEEMDKGVGALLLSEEILNGASQEALTDWLRNQPAWSDLPVLVSARPGVGAAALNRAFELLSNVTILERPMHLATPTSAVRSALRARERQLQLRTHLATLLEVDRRKTEFLATLAHELRNPMAPLTTTLAILRLKAPLPPGTKPYYDIMARQVEHMAKLVDDLMEVSRITRGKVELKLQRLFVASVIGEAVEISRPGIEARRHELVVEPVDPTLAVQGDPVRLTQVFSNLLNNAARYTPEGGRIHLQVREYEANLTVIVADTGIGIATDDLRMVFDMFVQVPGTARAAQGGLGIGLTLVRSLVELHGGQVQATSAGLNCGSEFSVTLPLAETRMTVLQALSEGPDPAAQGSKSLAGLSILVVDDNRDAADSLADLLLLHGAKVEVAYGGAEGLGRFMATRSKVAILDIGMPGIDGFELAQRLNNASGDTKPFLIALTGWGQAEDHTRILKAGFNLHLVKPVDFAELAASLSAVTQMYPAG